MYDVPQEVTYSYIGQAFGGGTITKYIQGPKGKRGRVTYVNANATVSFVGTATPGAVQVGVAGALTKFANMPMGAAGAGTAANASVVASDYASGLTGSNPSSEPATPYQFIPEDTQAVITLLAPTGGAPAGTADVFIKIEWH